MEEEKKSQEVTEEVKPEDEIISENEGFNDQEEKNIDSKISEEIIEGVDEKVLEKVDNEYNSDSLTVLEGLQAVRKRPGMYIGSTSSTGLHHLVWEIVDNGIDEALAGFCDTVTVTINPDNTITVTDNGRGIPTDIVAKTGLSGVETVYTVLHAGGKFGDGGGYKVSGGLHGVGASVVNALSEWVDVTVHKNGEIWYIRFENGGNAVDRLKKIGTCDDHGTIVTFKPDPEKDETKPCEATIYNPGCAAINKDNIDQYLNREDVLYIDTRNYEAYAAKHFRNFECIPFFALVYAMDGSKGVQLYHSDENNTKEPVPTYEESDDVLEMLFPKDKTLFLMCQSGGRVAMLMNILEARGWDMSKVYNITGMGSLIENAKLAEDVVVLEDQFNDVLKVEYGFANLTPAE